MSLSDWLFVLGGFVGAFLVGSFAEYVVHRLMHKRILLGQVHVDYHAEGYGQGFAKELKDYIVPSLPFIAGMALIAWLAFNLVWLAIGTAIGGVCYCLFAAYAHQVQHEFPELCCWMVRPVHHIHHAHKMWHHNFGIAFDIWDRVFFTYKKVDWKRPQPIRLRRFFQIKWI